MATEHRIRTRWEEPSTWPLMQKAAPALLALLRVGAALLFMQHGFQKLFGWFGGAGPTGGSVPLISLMGLAGVLELFGGALLLVGLLTRPVAFLLSGMMVVAYGMAHLPRGGVPVENQGELALLYAVVFAFLVGSGAGRFSLDHWLGERRRERRLAGMPADRLPGIPERRRDTAA